MVSVRVPLVIVTGFLGAGKTTLINRLLARRAARGATGKLGLVVNELGEVGIDGTLLAGDTTRQIELPGGCVCCALGDELDRTLLDLVRGNPGLEAIVLETTGVAEPLPIAWALGREPVASAVRLAAVVTLVDALHVRASRPVSATVDAQIAYADVVLVTKAHLASAEDLAGAQALVRELTERAAPPGALVRTGSTDEHAAWLEEVLADPTLEHAATGAAPHVHDEHCRHLPGHGHGVASVAIDVPDTVDLEELEDQLAELPPSYVRLKGIVRALDARGTPGWYAVHRVGLRVSSEPVPQGLPGGGRLVALGTELDPAALAACVARSRHADARA